LIVNGRRNQVFARNGGKSVMSGDVFMIGSNLLTGFGSSVAG
jgi:hypothetical protein